MKYKLYRYLEFEIGTSSGVVHSQFVSDLVCGNNARIEK